MRATTFINIATLVLSQVSLSVHAIPLAKSRAINTPLLANNATTTTKVRGVNLGGWLVLEPWITPSIFDNTGNDAIVDEYTFGQMYDSAKGAQVLKNHWDTWITEKDFVDIAAAGLNHIRLPIGYWAFDVSAGEPYHQGQYPYLLKAVQWAKNHGVQVWIDLHGAPGSQNGFDNSGQRGPVLWHTNQTNVDRTSAIINTLAIEFSKPEYKGTVVAIAPLNEPAGFDGDDVLKTTKKYWQTSYDTIRGQGDLLEVIHDAFQSLDYWNGFMSGSNNVALDTHQYQVFSDDQVAMSYDDHVNAACALGQGLASFTQNNFPVVVGEWTTAPTDCATYLNGRGVSARYDNIGDCSTVTGSYSNFSSDYIAFMRKFWEAQVTAYEQGGGWIYWTWKNEEADDWSYSRGLQGGWIPQNPDDRIYPNICG
ncbi:glycoside hydrolase family 5 protein [Botryobasidium botryosum FD-172 SS1]|uniref:Glycoside hydrolase family 5 protein n=1 Tax=Botryobasidium botryosum (strain FD-172 SS1) TaxID=930990 RepID=A0A067M9Y0_BOTB1|nr:glycoside hydrolase family 5 protein [Botryobasidium botryosum FD-172 SS1]